MARLMLTLKNCLRSRKKYAFYFACFMIFMTFFVFFKGTLSSTSEKPPEHTLCVLVPFRNAFEELQEFIPFMNEFLNRQSIEFYFIVVNHLSDGNRFNKGVCFNAGFEIISKKYVDCDYIALHDIDLLPLTDDIPYKYPGDEVYHVARPDLHPFGEYYDPQRYVGGIALISNKQYLHLNGFGNNFWGWGGEDRNFYYRMSNNSIQRVRPDHLTTNKTNTFKNIHSPYRIRDRFRCGNQKVAAVGEHDHESGLHDVKYEIISVHSMTIDDVPLTMFSIAVPCDYSKTPWCKPFCINNTQIVARA